MATTIEQFASLAAWTGSTGSFSVSGGRLYSNARAGTPSIARAITLTSGRPFRLVTQLKVHAGAASGWMAIAVQSAGTNFGIGVDRGTPKQYFGSVGTTFATGPGSIADATMVTVCIQADTAGISVGMTDNAGNVWCARRPWSDLGGNVTSVVIFGADDTTGTAGVGLGPLGVDTTGVTISPRLGIEDSGRPTAIQVAEGDTSIVLLPPGYSSTVPARAVVHCHGATNNQWEFVYDSGPDVPRCTAAQLAAGYIVAGGNFRGDSFGNDAGRDSVNGLASYLVANFNVAGLAISSDSMGGWVALNVIASGVHAWKAWVGYEPAYDLRTLDATFWRTGRGAGFASLFRAAYGIASDFSDLDAKAGASDPKRRAASRYTGLKAALWASPADTTVYKSEHTDVLAADLAAVATVRVTAATGGHNDPSHYDPSAVVAFLNATVVPPARPMLLGTEGQAGWVEAIAPGHAAFPFQCARVSDSWGTTNDAIRAHAALGADVLLLVEDWATAPATIVAQVQANSPAVTAVELGNEDSYSYKNGNDVATMRAKAGNYARAIVALRAALDAAGLASVKIIAQNDWALWSWGSWVNAMYAAVPGLHNYVYAWTLHPYIAGIETERVRAAISQAALHGCPLDKPIWLTEYGIATGDGATMDDNYGHSLTLTYAQAGDLVRQKIAEIAAECPSVERLYWYGMVDVGTDKTRREQNFGYLTRDLREKAYVADALASMIGTNRGTILSPWVADWTDSAAGTATSVTAAAPARAAREVLTAHLYAYNTAATIATPTGWTLVNSTTGGSTFRILSYIRVADGSGTDDFRASWSGSFFSHVGIARWVGARSDTVTVAGADNTGASLAPVSRGLTTDRAGSTLVGMLSTDDVGVYTVPTGFERVDNDLASAVAYQAQPTAGASGDKTWALGRSDTWATHMFAIAPLEVAATTAIPAGTVVASGAAPRARATISAATPVLAAATAPTTRSSASAATVLAAGAAARARAAVGVAATVTGVGVTPGARAVATAPATTVVAGGGSNTMIVSVPPGVVAAGAGAVATAVSGLPPASILVTAVPPRGGIVINPPSITRVSPTIAKPGTQVEVFGADFMTITEVRLSATPVEFEVLSPTHLVFVMPSRAGQLRIISDNGDVFGPHIAVATAMSTPALLDNGRGQLLQQLPDYFRRATNLVPNPRFMAGVLGAFTVRNASGIVGDAHLVEEPAIGDGPSLEVVVTANPTVIANGPIYSVGWTFPVQPGDVLSWGAACDFVTPGLIAGASISFRTATDIELTRAVNFDDPATGAVPSRRRVVVEGETAPANAAFVLVEVMLWAGDDLAATGRAIFDELMLSPTDTLPAFFDGDCGGARWQGPRFWSGSDRLGQAESIEPLMDIVAPYWYEES